ncbi:hypothetical protein [Streptacidiphilus monticola]|jgi:hypothetical protein|uniref:Uncharacterized protein n=1 Tax=Streptacidiphilus monticola TaxID=2161674 RepID=A0ABW1G0R2_9ACTN
MSAVLRVHWLPGTDRLLGRCHCGAEAAAEDPVELWAWLLAHPDHPHPPRTSAPAVPAVPPAPEEDPAP